MRRALSALALAFALAACSDGGGANPDAAVDAPDERCAAESLSLDDYYVCRSRLTCALLTDCRAADVTHLDCDDLPHEELGTGAQDRRLAAAAVAAGVAAWDGREAARCLVLLAARGCATFELLVAERAPCSGLVGLVPDGGTCRRHVDCASPGSLCAFDGKDPSCAAKTCVPPVATGAECGQFTPPCKPGDHCVEIVSGERSACFSGAIDQRCDHDADCDPEFFCLGGLNNGSAIGRCFPVRGNEQPCHTDRECAGELVCFGESELGPGLCRDLRAASAMCDDDFPCFGHRYCDLAEGDRGQCRTAPVAGDLCAPFASFDGFCGTELVCDAGRCRAPGRRGDPCVTSDVGVPGPLGCNRGLFCDDALTGATNGRCRPLQPDGEQCFDAVHCASGFCDQGVCAAEPPCGP